MRDNMWNKEQFFVRHCGYVKSLIWLFKDSFIYSNGLYGFLLQESIARTKDPTLMHGDTTEYVSRQHSGALTYFHVIHNHRPFLFVIWRCAWATVAVEKQRNRNIKIMSEMDRQTAGHHE